MELHLGQKIVNRSKSRFRVLATGRQFGKTTLGRYECEQRKGQKVAWLSPTYVMLKYAAQGLEGVDLLLPHNLHGMSYDYYDFIVVDETAMITEDITKFFNNVKSDVLMMGTPARGKRNQLREFFASCLLIEDGSSFCFPSVVNPHLEPEFFAEMYAALPLDVYTTDILGQFGD